MENRFFDLATRQAARLLGKRGRLMALLVKFAGKLGAVKWSDVRLQTFQEKFSVLGRLAKAYALGHYRSVPWRAMLILVAAILYFVNPLDLVPDIVPIAGLTDDFAVLVWVYNTLGDEVGKFLAWEKTRELPL
ncbi:YkvA family protein [Chryseolinea lacunae]|uniref:DUF1232 domain-containing protein n=1 Tax=Chryseolinea lacunae TaxID=2801331 RepID=A0ABS1KVF8_9BACT|nr:DUF1232 domain-containing protein [Chryseolinea lacunae]MBL0743222.1 DUF1232 domain-containing protein [Chryseolinea lacunae]